jgi:hypothetical protein
MFDSLFRNHASILKDGEAKFRHSVRHQCCHTLESSQTANTGMLSMHCFTPDTNSALNIYIPFFNLRCLVPASQTKSWLGQASSFSFLLDYCRLFSLIFLATHFGGYRMDPSFENDRNRMRKRSSPTIIKCDNSLLLTVFSDK